MSLKKYFTINISMLYISVKSISVDMTGIEYLYMFLVSKSKLFFLKYFFNGKIPIIIGSRKDNTIAKTAPLTCNPIQTKNMPSNNFVDPSDIRFMPNKLNFCNPWKILLFIGIMKVRNIVGVSMIIVSNGIFK